MRVALVGTDLDEIRPLLAEAGMEVVDAGFEAVVCYGGDGTMIGAERAHPGVPKLALRRNRDPEHSLQSLRRAASRDPHVTTLPKLEALVHGRRVLALNDVVVRNSNVSSAVRLRVDVDGSEYFGEVVGDGLLACTPFGSSAYFRSITNMVIHTGIGVAFINSTEHVSHLVIASQSVVRARITRGPAILAIDNDPCHLELHEGDELVVRRAPEHATVWEIENLLRMDSLATQPGRMVRWLQPLTPNGDGGGGPAS
jgi:NAD kinase